MATTQTIGGGGTLFVGEDKTLRLELLDPDTFVDGEPVAASVPINMAGWTLLFDVRLKDNSPDPAILSKTPTLTGV